MARSPYSSGAVPVPRGSVGVEFDDVRFGYPSADKVSLASLEEVAVLDNRGGDEVLHGISFTAEPGQMVALVGSTRQLSVALATQPTAFRRRGLPSIVSKSPVPLDPT